MKILFLCGGVGKRMQPLREDKFFFKFLGKELLLHHTGHLKALGFKEEDFVFVGNPANIERLRGLCGGGVKYAVQKSPRGMADAVLTANEENLIRSPGEDLLIVNPNDILEPAAYEAILKKGGARGRGDANILGYKVDKYFPGGYLVVEEGEKIRGIVEKPGAGKEPSDLINIVLHLHRRADEFIGFLEAENERRGKGNDRDDVYERAMGRMMKAGFDFRVVEYDGFWTAIKFPWHILNAMAYFLSTTDKLHEKQVVNPATAKIPESVKVEEGAGKVVVEAGAKIFDNVVIKGPAYIGRDSVVGNNALIRGSQIGDRCVVGYSTEIKNSYIGDDCWFHTNYVGDSVIGNGCSFGSGAVTANLRFDEKNISVAVAGVQTDTGLDKLGCLMAENCKVGVNASIMPGVKIGANSVVGAGTVVTQDLEPNKFLFFRAEQTLRENRVLRENRLGGGKKEEGEKKEERLSLLF